MELKELLLGAHFPEELAQKAAAFFQACAEARFAPPEVPRRRHLRAEAIELVEALEREKCCSP